MHEEPLQRPPTPFDRERFFELFIESSPLMMGICQVEGEEIRHLYANPSTTRFFERTLDEMRGRLSSELGVKRDVTELWLSKYAEAERTKAPVDFEFRDTRTKGERILSVTVTALGSSRYSYIVQDVTEKENEQRYRLVVEGMSDHGILRTDLSGKILDWNKGAESIFKFSKKEAIGENGSFIFLPEDRAAGKPEEEMRTALETGKAEDKRWHLRKDGSRFFANGVMSLLKDSLGNPIGFVKVVRDETERKLIEDAYQKAQQELITERFKLDALFQNAPAALALWSGEELRFELINPTYQNLFRGRELLGKTLEEALPEIKGQGFAELLRKVFETGEPYFGYEAPTALIHEKDGEVERRYFDFTFIQIKDWEGKPYGVFDHALDVTDRVRSLKAIEESKERLEVLVSELNKEKEMHDRFVAALSHDLRSPLSAVKVSAQLLEKKSPDAVTVQLSKKILDSITRADTMIQELLDSSRVKAGQGLRLERQACDLRIIVEAAIEELSTIHGERFKLSMDGDLRGYWSSSGLRRILENLCSNAVKYGDHHAPVVVTVTDGGDEVQLSVHNEGNPIPKKEQAKLFEPFRRTESAEVSRQQGWGLGLTLVKGLAEAHNGSVKVESRPGAGTTFTVHLPKK